jgi:hypothetical protein
MPKGHPISVPKVPWHEEEQGTHLPAKFPLTFPLIFSKREKCCGQGCSRCKRVPVPDGPDVGKVTERGR